MHSPPLSARAAALTLIFLTLGVPVGAAWAVPIIFASSSPISDPNACTNSDTTGTGINDAGQVVGWYPVKGCQGNLAGFLFSGGNFSAIQFPGSTGSEPVAINNIGQIIGRYQDSQGASHWFLDSNGTYSTLNIVTPAGTTLSSLNGINANGIIVGDYKTGNQVSHGFLYSLSAGTITATIDDPAAAPAPGFVQQYGTVAIGINDLGDVVGNFAPPICDPNINPGCGGFSPQPIAFVDRGGVFTTIPGLPSCGIFAQSSALGINNRGDVAGVTGTFEASLFNPVQCGFLQLADGTLGDPLLLPGGTALGAAVGINDGGQVLGFDALVSACCAPEPTALPEPSSLLLLATGLLAALAGSLRARSAD